MYVRNAAGIASRSRTSPREDRFKASQLLWRAERAGTQIGALCNHIYNQQGQLGVRRIQGVLSLAKKYGTAATEDACSAALEMGVREYRFVRRYLERTPPTQLAASRSSHSRTHRVSRSHPPKNPGANLMNVMELNRALRQLRLGGMAAVLETRLHQAQAEPMPPIDFLSCLVTDELNRRGDRCL